MLFVISYSFQSEISTNITKKHKFKTNANVELSAPESMDNNIMASHYSWIKAEVISLSW